VACRSSRRNSTGPCFAAEIGPTEGRPSWPSTSMRRTLQHGLVFCTCVALVPLVGSCEEAANTVSGWGENPAARGGHDAPDSSDGALSAASGSQSGQSPVGQVDAALGGPIASADGGASVSTDASLSVANGAADAFGGDGSVIAIGLDAATSEAGSAGPTFAAPSGPVARWPAGASPSANLPVHSLTYSPGPLDNPLKGFVPWFYSKTDYATGYPHSMEWSYFALSEVMSGPTTFDWNIVDQFLDEVASRGNQGALRFYVEYPGGTGSHPGNGIPAYLNGIVPMRTNTFWGTTSPDYDHPKMIEAFKNFIAVFGARYDGDARLAYVTMGLVGLWGEWHTWPCDGHNPSQCSLNLFPTDQTVNAIVDAYVSAFSRTPLLIRYPNLGGGHVATVNVGFHDDSFAYKEFRSGASAPRGLTLPVSEGGWPDAFLQKALDARAENRWTGEVIGGEARPEIQSQMFANYPAGSGQVDDILACIEQTHVTWLINQQGVTGYAAADAKVGAAVRKMGYELYVSNAYFATPFSAQTPSQIAIRIENRGVAPFPLPWKVVVAALDSQRHAVQTWLPGWDLRLAMPSSVRAFPDWNVGADPTYLPFGDRGQYFELTIPAASLAPGSYTLGLRVVNPLESITEAQIRATGHIEAWQKYSPPKPVRFANVEQTADGWLTLGTVQVSP
jgi:hypothetical protein